MCRFLATYSQTVVDRTEPNFEKTRGSHQCRPLLLLQVCFRFEIKLLQFEMTAKQRWEGPQMTARLFTFEPCKIEAGDQSNVYVIFFTFGGAPLSKFGRYITRSEQEAQLLQRWHTYCQKLRLPWPYLYRWHYGSGFIECWRDPLRKLPFELLRRLVKLSLLTGRCRRVFSSVGRSGWSSAICTATFGLKEAKSINLSCVAQHISIIPNRLGVDHQCDGQTDRRTDEQNYDSNSLK